MKSDELYWTEKYRPLHFDDFVGNSETISRLKAIAEHGNIPNLLLTGPPGTGKTTSVVCLANTLLGSQFRDAVLELNASDDRGIDIVRSKIKHFAQRKSNMPHARHKIVFLDEADSMTAGAQQALRRIMEIYSSTTRFVLACNQSNKVIEPIQSRCAIVGFTKLCDKAILDKLLEICVAENLSYANSGLEAITFTADGDMRQALNNLQILRECIALDIENACINMEKLYNLGYSPIDIVIALYKVVQRYEPIQEFLKLEFLREIGLVHMRLEVCVQSCVQLTGLLAKLCKHMCKSTAFI